MDGKQGLVDLRFVEQVVRDFSAVRRPGTDPELEAVHTAILLEDMFGVTLSDTEITPAVLASTPAVAALVARLWGAI